MPKGFGAMVNVGMRWLMTGMWLSNVDMSPLKSTPSRNSKIPIKILEGRLANLNIIGIFQYISDNPSKIFVVMFPAYQDHMVIFPCPLINFSCTVYCNSMETFSSPPKEIS